MKKQSIYLDTSIINFLFADDAPEKKEITQEFFRNILAKGKYIAYVSTVVIEEIQKTKEAEKKEKLLNVIYEYHLEILDLSEEAIDLSNLYLTKKVIPKKKIEDARHLAIATVYKCDILLSWNFRHLANINKERKVTITNLEVGYNQPLRLLTPLEVIGK